MTSRVGNRGFTLLELIVVLLIVGIASGVVFFALSSELRKSTLKYEVRKVYAALRHAREVAVTRHAEVAFAPDEDGGGYAVTQPGKTLFSRRLPKGITMDAAAIYFTPLGDCSGGTVTISHESGRRYELSVSGTTGKIEVGRLQSF